MDTRADRLETRTARLRLVALDAGLARLQIEDRRAFFAEIGAERESAWPPVADDAAKLPETLDTLTRHPEQTGWRGWVFLMGWTPGGLDRAVGTGGFFGPPDAGGVIEIGYAMAASFREQGMATEAVTGLLSWAFSHDEVQCVLAFTEPHLSASRRVLEKTGFKDAGEETRAGVLQVRYERVRTGAAGV
jgi:RimJ/RimL family protein N-acetyltransferase